MAEKFGKLFICDICGATEFVEYIGTDRLDGGYTRIDNYEELSAGWQYSSDLSARLCPTCSAAWEQCKKDYLRNYKRIESD